MTKDEALKIALQALKTIDEAMPFPVAKLAQKAIKEALAQPEEKYQYGTPLLDAMTKDYVPPQRTWVGLTDREIDELWMSHHDDFGNPLSATGYEKAIEAKLKDKNGF